MQGPLESFLPVMVFCLVELRKVGVYPNTTSDSRTSGATIRRTCSPPAPGILPVGLFGSCVQQKTLSSSCSVGSAALG